MVETAGEPEELPPVDSWINKVDFRSTGEVKIPERLVDQVIGQERAVEVIRKAAEQKRHVMLIGDPGTGKSMLARAMTELLPRDDLQDIIVYHNPEDPNEPKIRVVPAGKGREIVNAQKAEAMQRREQKASMVMTIVFFIIGLSVILSYQWGAPEPSFRTDAPNIILFGILVAAIIYIATRYTGHRQENLMVPKLLVSHTADEMPPFIDATGSHAGALLGDVKHDPFQSGGLETPAHERVESGAIHKAHKGVLFVDEINRLKLVRFVAQEVSKDRKIPHFDRTAVLEILREAQRRAGRRGQLTLRLRELGGLIRVAGDIAQEEGTPLVTAKHVLNAKRIARSLEQQVADRMIERGKEYQTFITEGSIVGMVNGLAVLVGDNSIAEFSGIVLPIAAEVTPAQAKQGGRIIATGRLGEIAKEAVENVAALIKKYTGEDISNHDIHVQFVGSREGTEGDSASISVATAVISALEEVPVNQGVAMTGSLSVRGQVLPVGGVTAKIEAAAELGIGRVVIPRANMKDVLLEDKYQGKIEIVPVDTLSEVLEQALVGPKKSVLISKLAALVPKMTPDKPGPAAVPH